MKGSCLCGNVNFVLDIDPSTANAVSTFPGVPGPKINHSMNFGSQECACVGVQTSLCHCRPCRKITGGTTSLNLTVPSKAFQLTSGSGALKTVKTKHMDEGFEFSLSFCPECGSPIYAVPHFEPQPDIVVVQAGTLDDVSSLEKTPATELNVKHRLPWVAQIDGAAQKEKYT